MQVIDLQGLEPNAAMTVRMMSILRSDGEVLIINAFATKEKAMERASKELLSKIALTHKEAQIVACLVQGLRNKEIAVRLDTSEQVIKNYLRRIYDKTGVDDRLGLGMFFFNHNLVPALPLV